MIAAVAGMVAGQSKGRMLPLKEASGRVTVAEVGAVTTVGVCRRQSDPPISGLYLLIGCTFARGP